MSFLDQAIANTNHGSPTIVSENHNIGDINFVNGLTDPGEMIRCGYLPQLRRLQGEQDKEYAERIRPLVMALSQKDRDVILTAAIERAGLDTSNGRISVMVAGEAPWHRLGVNIAEAVNSAQAIKLSGTDWRVIKSVMMYTDPTSGQAREQKEVFGLVREDTGAFLGSVGSRYQIIQNEQGFAFLDKVLDTYGAKYESAGSVHGGKRVWMLVRLPQQSFAVNSKDPIEAFALFMNPHDGKSGSALCIPTSNRVVCNNTLRVATNAGKGKGIALRHTGGIETRINDAQAALGIAVKEFSRFKEVSEVMYNTPLPHGGIRHYAEDVLNAALQITEAGRLLKTNPLEAVLKMTETERELEMKKLEKRDSFIEDILTRYESDKNGVNGMRGSVWSGLNSITEFADFGRYKRFTGQANERDSRRFENAITGDGDTLKQIAYETAQTYIGGKA